MPKHARKPFEVKLSDQQRDELALELARTLDDAITARSVKDAELEYFHTLYEQGRTRTGREPWKGAADLTSYLGTMYVDVLRSQIVRTVMLDPVFVVEGYGEAEQRAPFVEEFHAWQIEAEGFQQVFARAVHLALIEPRGIIEVYEDTVKRPVRRVIKAALELNPMDGSAMVGPDLQPKLQMGPNGKFVEVTDETTPSAEVEIDSFETVSHGPRERTIAYRDFLELPGHAHDKSEVWGYAKRFYRRLDQLKERADAGLYDADQVEELGSDDERASETTLAGTPIDVATKEGTDQAEKELWELLFLKDLGEGLRWYVATLSKDKQVLLRIQYDDIGRPRYFSLVPFPRPNSNDGYSYVGHKLITVIEEHTAWRNMLTDRASLQLQAPLMRKRGALWNPDTEPIGPRSILPFREPNEIVPLVLPDTTQPAIERIRDAERAGERLSGINDAAAGVQSEDQRTLGEIQLITEQSMGRSTEAIKNLQETLEEIAQVRHLMWKRALAEMGAEGMEMPPSVLQGLETRGVDLSSLPNKRFTALMLEGQFRFKPRGSTEDADLNRKRRDFNEAMIALANLSKINPMIAAVLQTPQAAKAMIEQIIRLHSVDDKQAFLGSAAAQAIQQAQMQMQMMQQMQMMAGMAGGPPGGPGGAPPPPPGLGPGGPPPQTPPPMGVQAA